MANKNNLPYINKITNPKGLKKDQYDVIIIGAGIGGLVCGCYLAKAGLKVLIVEKNQKPGGYCTSFERDGFRFDSCVHSLEGFGENGKLFFLSNELNLWNYLKIIRVDPSDTFFIEDKNFSLWNNYNKTIYNLQEIFPNERKNIFSFLNWIKSVSFFELYRKYINLTAKELLDIFFLDKYLKKIFYAFCRNYGVPIENLLAINFVLFLKEYIFDNGYYPYGGMQALPNALVLKFKEYGGKLLLNSYVSKIIFKDDKAIGAVVNKNILLGKKIVSACDLTNTLLKLIGKEYIPKKILKTIKNYIYTTSVFLVYLGFKKSFLFKGLNNWFFKDWDFDFRFNEIFSKNKIYAGDFLLTQAPYSESKGKTAFITINVNYKTKKFWKFNKDKLSIKLIKNLEKLFPNIKNNIEFFESVSPLDLEKITENKKGTLHGWVSTFKQLENISMLRYFSPKNIFFVGHWIFYVGHGGIPAVVENARITAKKIIDKKL